MFAKSILKSCEILKILKSSLKIRSLFQGHRTSGWNIVEVGLSTLSGGVDKSPFTHFFGVDMFVHKRLEFQGKRRFLPQMRPL
jgi:hypothetical protein